MVLRATIAVALVSAGAAAAPQSPAALPARAQVAQACAAGVAGAGPLTVELDPAALAKLRYDDRALVLLLDGAAAEEGAVVLDGGDLEARADATPETAGAWIKARALGRLRATATFRLREPPPDGLAQICVSLGGGRFLRVRATPLWIDLRDGARTLRLLTAPGEEEPGSGQPPRVDVSPIEVSGGDLSPDEQRALASAIREAALACFRSGDGRGGVLGVALRLSRDGAAVSTPIDMLHDEPLRRCVVQATNRLRFPSLRSGARVSFSLTFRRGD